MVRVRVGVNIREALCCGLGPGGLGPLWADGYRGYGSEFSDLFWLLFIRIPSLSGDTRASQPGTGDTWGWVTVVGGPTSEL